MSSIKGTHNFSIALLILFLVVNDHQHIISLHKKKTTNKHLTLIILEHEKDAHASIERDANTAEK